MRGCGLVVVGLLLAACGARTGLEVEPYDAGTVDAFVPTDAPPPECVSDDDCDDGLDCSRDTCEGGSCVRRADHGECDDGRFCTGPGTCDLERGCVFETDPCDDGISCTDSDCFERSQACFPVPRNDLCPVSTRCDVDLGCVARALVHDLAGVLWEVDLPGGRVARIADTRLDMTDIALTPDGRTFVLATGAFESSLVEIDESDGTSRRVGGLGITAVALDALADGTLVASGGSSVFRVDPETARTVEFARFPPPYEASGDIAFVRGRMLVTGTDEPFGVSPDVLFEVPAGGGELIALGSVGSRCVWGLAPFGDTLYGFDCEGRLLDIDPNTGAGTVLLDVGPQSWGGAAAR